jgi:uncharacterized membrane protein
VPGTPTLRTDARVVVAAFTVSGVVHLVRPQTFEPLMPGWVPAHRKVILASGVLELVCAAGLLVPATRRAAGLASTAVLLGVFPGNIKMALDASRSRNQVFQAAAYARLPLQLPLIRGAWRTARSPR